MGILQEEGLSALVWSLAEGRRQAPEVGPGSTLPLPTPWALSLLTATGHGCLRGVYVGLCRDCGSVLAAALFPTPTAGATGHPAPRARGWGNRTGCSVGLVPEPVSPTVPGRNPMVGPRGALRVPGGGRGGLGCLQGNRQAAPTWPRPRLLHEPPRELGLRSGLSVHLPPRTKSR